jgi:protoheme IX farnesyltransferase
MDQMLWYTLILIGLSVLPVTFGAFGITYLVSALVLGVTLLLGVVRVRQATNWAPRAWWVYKYSLLYLALVFASMIVDRYVGRG